MVGLLSGMFGVGGGFILTPLLFFIGIPPAVAVASAANQIAGSSFSALLAHLRRRPSTSRWAWCCSPAACSARRSASQLFTALRATGPVRAGGQPALRGAARHHRRADAAESVRALRRRNDPNAALVPRRRHTWAHGLPLKMRFRTSQALRQRHPALRDRRRRRHPRRDHGRRRRLHHGAGDDLPDRHADQGGGRHLGLPVPVRHRLHHGPARGRRTAPSTCCSR